MSDLRAPARHPAGEIPVPVAHDAAGQRAFAPAAGTTQGPAVLRLLRGADLLSALAGWLCALMILAIAAMLAYEVTARYVFHAPTRWTSDVATTLMISLTFLAMAQSLRQRRMIRITALVGGGSPRVRRLAEAFSLLVILGFATLAVWLCAGAMAESYAMGRRQPTMLQMPEWIAELPIVLGYGLLGLQALANLLRLPWRPAPDFGTTGDPEAQALTEETP